MCYLRVVTNHISCEKATSKIALTKLGHSETSDVYRDQDCSTPRVIKIFRY